MAPISLSEQDGEKPRLSLRLLAELADGLSPHIQDQSVQASEADGLLSDTVSETLSACRITVVGGTWDSGPELETFS